MDEPFSQLYLSEHVNTHGNKHQSVESPYLMHKFLFVKWRWFFDTHNSRRIVGPSALCIYSSDRDASDILQIIHWPYLITLL